MNTTNSNSGTRVYILGAGCSAKYGYPVSKNFVDELETYSQTLDDKAKRVKRCVDEAASLMRRGNVPTIDDLVSRVGNSVFDDPSRSSEEKYAVRIQRIRNAKIATAALFLSKEAAAKKTGLSGYHDFIHKLFPGANHWGQRFKTANSRVLTFNYDRLFEMALLERFGIDTGQFPLYGERVLNSGFNDIIGRDISFGTGGFQFLKLHGSVGMRVGYDHVGFRHYPYFDGQVPGAKIEISDQSFFANADAPNPHDRDPEPLIVFPYEKQYAQSGTYPNLPFGGYISSIWKQAEVIVTEATEIWIVGYSFAALDRKPILDLLAKAKRCKKFVIQNKVEEAGKICSRLSNEHSDLEITWQPYTEEF